MLAMIISFKVDKSSSQPIYKQLIDSIIKDIEDGRFDGGTALPSSRDLAESLKIARDTVVKAYRELLRLGYLISDTTSGTYANMERVKTQPSERQISSRPLDSSQLSTFARKIGRELNKYPSSPDFAGLNYGAVPRAALPMRRWRELMQQNCVPETFRNMEYEPDVLGRPELREALKGYLSRSKGITSKVEQIAVFSVSSGILNVLLRLLVEPGQAIAVEEPGFGVVRNIARSLNIKINAVPVDDEGLVVSALNDCPDKIKVVYITPNHQDPTGAIMSPARRQELLAWAHKHNAWILEDDYDGNFYYSGEPPEHFWTLSPDANVIYIASFWQILYPLTSISICVVPQSLISYITAVRKLQTEDMADTMVQLTLAQLLGDGYLEKHLSRVQKTFAKRRIAAIHLLKTTLADKIVISDQSSGNYFRVMFNSDSDSTITLAASKAHLPLVSTATYYLGEPVAGEFLFNFTLLSEDNATIAIADFARALG